MKFQLVRYKANKGTKNERGQILAIVLALLVLGSLIVAPALTFGSTTLTVGRASAEREKLLYAADSGVEDALWKIRYDYDNTLIPKNITDTPFVYNLTGLNGATNENVTINCQAYNDISKDYRYKITSVANKGTSSTTVTVYLTYNRDLFQFSAVSHTTVVDWSKVDLITPTPPPSPYTGPWPTADLLKSFYLPQTPYPTTIGSPINITSNTTIPSGYCSGSLTINLNTDGVVATLASKAVIYVDGNLVIAGKSASKTYTLDLNGGVLFATGSIDINKLNFKGSGAIVALGPIKFSPNNIVGSPSDFVFLFSANSTIDMQPGIDFFGTIAAEGTVKLQPHGDFINTYPPPLEINFPVGWSLTRWESRRP